VVETGPHRATATWQDASGSEPLTGPDLVELQQALFRFLYVTTGDCARTAHGGVENGSSPAPEASERDR
jgi:hypothetical protein